jgi:hypothetical protein
MVTIQTAMVYLDKLIQLGCMKEIERYQNLWTGTALLIASKFCELDNKLIKIEELSGMLITHKFSKHRR